MRQIKGMPMFVTIFLKRMEEETCEPWEETQIETAADRLRELQPLADSYDSSVTIWHTCLEIMEQSKGAADTQLWFRIVEYLKYEMSRKH